MYFYLKDNKLTKYNENIKVISDYDANGIEACIDEKGFALFNQLPKSIREKAVVKDNSLKLGKTKINTFEAKMPNFNCNYTKKFDCKVHMIQQASKFTDNKDKGNPILTGVCINSNGTVYASDRFRAYMYSKGSSEDSIVISSDVLDELNKINYGDSGDVEIKYNETSVSVTLPEGTQIIGRTLNGKFPNLSNILQGDYQEIKIDIIGLKDAMKIGKLVGDNIMVELSNNEITFHSDNEYNQIFEADNVNICLSFKFLETVLSVINIYSKDVKVYYYGENKPLVFSDCEEKKVLILPIRK